MKCPLLRITRQLGRYVANEDMTDCLKEECAWWDAANNTCAVLTLAQGIVYTYKELLKIADRLPKDVAPGK